MDVPLEMQYQEQVRELSMLEVQHSGMRNQQRIDENISGSSIVELEQAVDAARESLALLDRRREKLTLTAPVSGIVLPPPEKKADPKVDGRLPSWDGSLMRSENLGARVEQDDVICIVGDPTAFEAMLVIDQADLPFVETKLPALIRLDAYAGDTLEGEIVDIAGADMEVASPTMSTQTGGQMALVTDASGVQRPQSASYEARVPLRDMSVALRSGMRGRAKVKAAKQTLIARLWRILNRTFHFNI